MLQPYGPMAPRRRPRQSADDPAVSIAHSRSDRGHQAEDHDAADPRGPSELRRQQYAVAAARSQRHELITVTASRFRFGKRSARGTSTTTTTACRTASGSTSATPCRSRRRHALQTAVRVPDHRPRQPAERQRPRPGRSYQPGEPGVRADVQSEIKLPSGSNLAGGATLERAAARPGLRPAGNQPAARFPSPWGDHRARLAST